MPVNDSLEGLYKNKYNGLTELITEYNCLKNIDRSLQATNPLMLRVPQYWEIASLKIMIFGQETNYWGHECGNNAVFCGRVKEVIDVYEKFYLNNRMYNSPFWNEFRRIKKHFQKNQTVSVLWNNLVKIGRQGTGNLPAINQITKDHFNLIAEEVKITKPDFLVFFTGPHYDKFILEYLGPYEQVGYSGYHPSQICEIKFDYNYGIKKAIRINHPNYLYRNKLRKRIMDKLISELERD